jgi:uncharacterized Zn finger protein
MSSVADLIEPAALNRLAAAPTLAAGRTLASADRVHLTIVGPLTVAARVDGPGRPATALSATGETLHWSCTCPEGRGGAFCAHLVATAQVARDHAPDRR